MIDLVIVGAGPAGLAAAIAAEQAGLGYRVLEKGVLVNSIFHFPKSMVFFTTPDLLEIGNIPFTTPHEKPTREETLRYYRRVAETYQLKIGLGEEVRAIEHQHASGRSGQAFRIKTLRTDGRSMTYDSRYVILATGYYDHPNMLGVPGEDLPHVSHYYSEAHAYYRKKVVIVGGSNSAAEAALNLYREGAQVTLIHRRDHLSESIKYWVRPNIENRIKEGSIAARFNAHIVEVRPTSVMVEDRVGMCEELPADAVLLLTGYHPDIDLLKRVGIKVDEETYVPEHDPESFETNIPGLYLAGAVVSGRQTNRVFIENGRFHGGSVIEIIMRRRSAGVR